MKNQYGGMPILEITEKFPLVMSEDIFSLPYVSENFDISLIKSVMDKDKTPQSGAFGFIFIGIGEDENKYLIKFQTLLRQGVTLSRKKHRQISPDKTIAYKLVKFDEFLIENKMQIDIYNKSIVQNKVHCQNYNNIKSPICPKILGVFNYNKERALEFLNVINNGNNELIETFIGIVNEDANITLGVTIMEYLENYISIESIISSIQRDRLNILKSKDKILKELDNKEKELYEGAACIISDFHELGYIHKDYHTGNILYNKDLNSFKIIDFGISEENHNDKKICEEGKLQWIKKYAEIKKGNIENSHESKHIQDLIFEYNNC